MNCRYVLRGGFTLVEALVAMAIVGIAAVALYAGIATGVFQIRLARENLRATQILLEKVEVVRLCTWDQIVSNKVLQTSFTVPYDPAGTNSGKAGPIYTGTITVTNAPGNLPYQNHLRLVTVEVNWTTQDLQRSRQISTLISRHGLYRYMHDLF